MTTHNTNIHTSLFLGSGVDLAHHHYDAYQVGDEIHIVYDSGHIMSVKISLIHNHLDEYLWTPFIEWVHKCR